MLDELKLIHTRDSQDALGIAEKQWQQYRYNFSVDWQPPREIHNVVVAGMGGSGLAAKAFKVWPSVNAPFEIVQDYSLPNYVSAHTLVVFSSYSGNTEETLSCFETAMQLSEKNRPMMAAVSAGGKLADLAKENHLPHLAMPGGIQPRMTFGYQLRALVQLFEHINLIEKGTTEQLEATSNWLKDEIAAWRPDVATKNNQAKQIAQEMAGKSVVIYGGPQLAPVAYKWKINFNENAKHIAWYNAYPEFNHNEFLGWTKQPTAKPYAVIDLRSNLAHPQIQKRFTLSAKLLSGKSPAPLIVEAKGETLPAQMLWLVALGDFVSLYTAILEGTDPTPIPIIDKLKQQLS
jgi:glucose/mannose-6-phosphate isomerase